MPGADRFQYYGVFKPAALCFLDLEKVLLEATSALDSLCLFQTKRTPCPSEDHNASPDEIAQRIRDVVNTFPFSLVNFQEVEQDVYNIWTYLLVTKILSEDQTSSFLANLPLISHFMICLFQCCREQILQVMAFVQAFQENSLKMLCFQCSEGGAMTCKG